MSAEHECQVGERAELYWLRPVRALQWTGANDEALEELCAGSIGWSDHHAGPRPIVSTWGKWVGLEPGQVVLRYWTGALEVVTPEQFALLVEDPRVPGCRPGATGGRN
jgi:hypothetical protein